MKTVYIIEDEYYRILRGVVRDAITRMENRLEKLIGKLGLRLEVKKEEDKRPIHYTDAVVVLKKLRPWVPCKLEWEIFDRLEEKRFPCLRKYTKGLYAYTPGQVCVLKLKPGTSALGFRGISATESWIYVEGLWGCSWRAPYGAWIEEPQKEPKKFPFEFVPTFPETEYEIKERKRRQKKQVLLGNVLSNVVAHFARDQYVLSFEKATGYIGYEQRKNCYWVEAEGLDTHFNMKTCHSTIKNSLGHPPTGRINLRSSKLDFDQVDKRRIQYGIDFLEDWDKRMQEEDGIYEYER